MITTDKNDPRLNNVKDNGQNEAYLVLSEYERAKGFVRPVRTSYIHMGRNVGLNIEMISNPLDDKIARVYQNTDRTSFIEVTDEELKSILVNKGYLGGCRALTTMSQILAETYAADPKFYGATYCTVCNKHFPVSEFVWAGTDELVGS